MKYFIKFYLCFMAMALIALVGEIIREDRRELRKFLSGKFEEIFELD